MTLRIDGTLLLAGAGNMGTRMLAGWLERGLDPRQIIVQDPAPPPRAKELLAEHGIDVRAAVGSLPEPPAVIVLAVKPQIMDQVFPPLAQLAGRAPWCCLSPPAAPSPASSSTCRKGRRRALHAQYAGLHRPRHHRRGRQRARHAGAAGSLRRSAARRRRGRLGRRRGPARCRDRGVGLGPGLRVLPRRVPGRGRHQGRARARAGRRSWRAARWQAPASCCTAPTSAPTCCARTSPRPAAPRLPPCRC